MVGRLVLVAALCVSSITIGAPKRDAPAAAIDNVCLDTACSRRALDGFAAALATQRTGRADRALRVSYIGDSLTADDQITGALREKLAALVGDGGPGFVFAAPPHPLNQHRALSRWLSPGWQVNGLSSRPAPDHLLGLGGSAETTTGGTIRFTAAAPISRIDVHYLGQPRGGEFDIVVDGTVVTSVDTSATKKTAAFASADLPDGTRKLELRARGRVRLFGASLEADTGAVVDNLGVISATAKQMSRHNLAGHLRGQLAHRAPDLTVIMLGTNEAEWLSATGTGMAEHERLFGELLANVRAATPGASCLVVSPLEQTDRHAEDLPPRLSVPAMVDAQHRAATANGCAFWDVYAWMGGKGASKQWLARGLMMKDYQHPTAGGAQRIASALYSGLVR